MGAEECCQGNNLLLMHMSVRDDTGREQVHLGEDNDGRLASM